jgi:serine/threonine-protein kinase PknG
LHPSLGAGIVEVPTVAYKDPLSAIMDNPVVAEEIRFCSGCLAPVGRGSATSRGEAQGRCFNCGTPFSFVPPLRRGDVVGSQYQVQGCLSYGGQGWIYLAKDHNVSGRCVVLKGIIHAESPAAAAAALNEQRFLAEVQHPNIVEIYNFVWHEQTRTSYIVMEYLGGPTLQDIALHQYHHTNGEPLPVGQVIAYGLEILRTFSYLHGLGLLYCDLKPSNVIQLRDRIKLIDLGGVRWQNDTTTPLIHTDGFSAPELATQGASVASDIFAVARTIAALTLNLDDGGHLVPSPGRRTDDSAYYRVLQWASQDDPLRRPRSADEMAAALAAALS